MKKLQKVLFIILLIALFIGAAGVLAGTIMGASPVEIGQTIVAEAAVRANFDSPALARLLPSPTPDVAETAEPADTTEPAPTAELTPTAAPTRTPSPKASPKA